jgi:hypothetical protein
VHTEEWKITGVPVGSSLRRARLVIFEAASTRITNPDILQALRLGSPTLTSYRPSGLASGGYTCQVRYKLKINQERKTRAALLLLQQGMLT